MRLQVTIHRHTLPPVRLIYNTASAPDPIKTVADLLNGLNALVPLESADGEWGLEDYIVEVAATADQDKVYECLHFQSVKEVLNDDDEIVIRGLTSDELRERRQGGRLQISSDGRHLFDGVSWGRKWRAQAYRPDVHIPPRKRRRLLAAEDDDTEEDDEVRQLEHFSLGGQIGTDVDREDTDSDYEENAEEGEFIEDFLEEDDFDGENSTADSERPARPLQIVARQEFEDADEEEEDDEDEDFSAGEEELDLAEIQLLLKEAAELETEDSTNEVTSRSTRPPRKRRRLEQHDTNTGPRKVMFAQSTMTQTMPHKKTDNSASRMKLGPYVVRVNDHSSDHDTSGDSDDSFSSSDSLSKRTGASSVRPNARTESTSSSGSSTSEPGSSSGSESASDAEESDASDLSESEAGAGEHNTGQTTSPSSSDDTESDEEGDSSKHNPIHQLNHLENTRPGTFVTMKAQPPKKDNAPGTGLTRTKNNNERIKRRKRLTNLKVQGLLQEQANFADLRAYEAEKAKQKSDATTDHGMNRPSDSETAELQRRKDELLAAMSINASESLAELVVAKDAHDPDAHVSTATLAEHNPDVDPVERRQQDTNMEDRADTERESPKRVKLDLASSRRMLFNSLGLKTPKTREAEDALRQKLSQATRRNSSRPSNSEPQNVNLTTAVDNDLKDWKKKLTIFAVECVQDDVTMTPPPFPFVQHWERRNSGEQKRRSEQYYDANTEDALDYGNEELSRPHSVEGQILNAEPDQRGVQKIQTSADSYTISVGTTNPDSLGIAEDIAALPQLEDRAITRHAVIAYKELQMNDRFEPEHSPYRIGCVTNVKNDTVTLTLLNSNGRSARPRRYDATTGERLFHGFELPDEADDGDDDDDDNDDGVREIRVGDMIDAKLVKQAIVEVPASSHDESSAAARSPHETGIQVITDSLHSVPSMQPEVVVEPVEVNTPTRDQITTMIKDAGFDSALDERLLLPIQSARDSVGQSVSISHVDPEHFTHGEHSTEGLADYDNSALAGWDSSAIGSESHLVASRTYTADGTSSPVSRQHLSTVLNMPTTVDYPHVSQIDIRESSLPDQTESSSHQDAQRTSSSGPDFSPSLLSHKQLQADKYNSSQISNQSVESPASEVPFSQQEERVSAERILTFGQSTKPAVKLRGGIGQEESISGGRLYTNNDHSCDEDSDGLPSLLALTSSQKYQAVSRVSNNHVSPPPLKKHEQDTNNKDSKMSAKSADKARVSMAADSSPASGLAGSEDDVSSTGDVNFEASQSRAVGPSHSQNQPRAKQISQDSHVIGLTFSSDLDQENKEIPTNRSTSNAGRLRSSQKRQKQDSVNIAKSRASTDLPKAKGSRVDGGQARLMKSALKALGTRGSTATRGRSAV